MSRSILLSVLVLSTLSAAAAEPLPKVPLRTTGILVFDDCDAQYEGKKEYKDNLTLFDSTGEVTFRVSGFNNCESIGCSRMIAVDFAKTR